MGYSQCLPTLLKPLAERTSRPQVFLPPRARATRARELLPEARGVQPRQHAAQSHGADQGESDRGSGGSTPWAPGCSPPGRLHTHLHAVYMEYSECRLLEQPLAERTPLPQVLMMGFMGLMAFAMPKMMANIGPRLPCHLSVQFPCHFGPA
jgi:hypothetical protein